MKMLNPGDYSLCDASITTALASVPQTPIQDLEGILGATVMAKFSYGSGGTTAKAYLQITPDDGLSWIDIACFAFTTASATKVVNFSGLTPVLTPVVPSDGALADNTFIDGILGSSMRAKLLTTGTYANTLLSLKFSAR
jgi:hypothetical protein